MLSALESREGESVTAAEGLRRKLWTDLIYILSVSALLPMVCHFWCFDSRAIASLWFSKVDDNVAYVGQKAPILSASVHLPAVHTFSVCMLATFIMFS